MDVSRQNGDAGRTTVLHDNMTATIGELQQELTRQSIALERERIARRLSEDLNQGQIRLLEMVARDAPLQDVLTQLMLLIESQSRGVHCTTMLLNEQSLTTGAAPSMPREFSEQLEGLPIGPQTGSCGTAMYLKKQVIVTSIDTDPLWQDYRHMILPYGYHSCWSTPILQGRDKVLGAFAMYAREERGPNAHDLALIDFATHIAGVAIEHTRREQALARSRANLEQLVDTRTSELIEANAQLEQSNQSLSQANQSLEAAMARLQVAQQELIQREKMSSLGALATGITNALNAPIGNCIMAITHLCDSTHSVAQTYQTGIKRSELENYLKDAVTTSDMLLKNIKRAADLMTGFKQVTVDQTSSQRRRFALQEYIADLIKAIQAPGARSVITINQKIQPGLVIDSYPGALGQVITNLVTNSLEHAFDMRDTGSITLLAHPIDADNLELVINDTGIGMSNEARVHLFDPIYSARHQLGVSGFGLHITHTIVTGLLGGKIRVQSEPGIGTTFYLTLPFSAPAAGNTTDSEPQPTGA